MPNYQIYRYKKLKSKTAMTHALKHNLRVGRQQANVRSELSHKNNYGNLVTVEQCNKRRDAVLKGLSKPPRKNAVFAHEVVVTASPDAFKQGLSHNYFNDAVKHIADLHGGMQNLVSVAIHLDEETPHMHVIMMPCLDNKLQSRKVIGGHSKRMSELQTLFHREVSEKYGLDRGEFKSKRKHNPINKIGSKIENTNQQFASLEQEYKVKLKRSEKLSETISHLEHEIIGLDSKIDDMERFRTLNVDELRVKLAEMEQDQARELDQVSHSRPRMR